MGMGTPVPVPVPLPAPTPDPPPDACAGLADGTPSPTFPVQPEPHRHDRASTAIPFVELRVFMKVLRHRSAVVVSSRDILLANRQMTPSELLDELPQPDRGERLLVVVRRVTAFGRTPDPRGAAADAGDEYARLVDTEIGRNFFGCLVEVDELGRVGRPVAVVEAGAHRDQGHQDGVDNFLQPRKWLPGISPAAMAEEDGAIRTLRVIAGRQPHPIGPVHGACHRLLGDERLQGLTWRLAA